MAHTFLSEHEVSFVSRSKRFLINKRKEERQFQKQFANFLLQGGMPENVARSILNGGILFPHEDLQAQAILQQTILDVFSKTKDFCGYKEPITLEGIVFMFRLIDKNISPELQPIIGRIIEKRIVIEKQKYEEITSQNELLIAECQHQINERNKRIEFNYPFAILSLLSVLAGIVTLFIGFKHWTYIEMLVGAALLFPVFFIQDSPNALIRLRADTEKEREINSYYQTMTEKLTQINLQKQKITHLEKQLQALFSH